MNKINNKERETSWHTLTSDNLKGVKAEHVDIKDVKDVENVKEESLEAQVDNHGNDDYTWENM